ncbi:hypothetical protein Pmani_007013 [Petrolisthes manimaculis]|uniref:Uncharacterized protein n=1 Tax=Petrolisthes manimaculis TaxID=1843537 RepID=A0AAE1Q8L3_9EUCA|nr:hypothetical protein Pmani_007013 [Petrolisthes manimaculis]
MSNRAFSSTSPKPSSSCGFGGPSKVQKRKYIPPSESDSDTSDPDDPITPHKKRDKNVFSTPANSKNSVKRKIIITPSKYPGLLFDDESEITDEDDNGDLGNSLPSAGDSRDTLTRTWSSATPTPHLKISSQGTPALPPATHSPASQSLPAILPQPTPPPPPPTPAIPPPPAISGISGITTSGINTLSRITPLPLGHVSIDGQMLKRTSS